MFDCCVLSTGSREWDGSWLGQQWHVLCSSACVAVGRPYPAAGRAEETLRQVLERWQLSFGVCASHPSLQHCSGSYLALGMGLEPQINCGLSNPCLLIYSQGTVTAAQLRHPRYQGNPTRAACSGLPLLQGCPGRWLPIPTGHPVPVTQVSASQADYLHLETPNPFARLAQTPSPLLPTVLWPWTRSKATP